MQAMTFELIGMLDSPYVRRVAVSMHLMELPFVHRSISVFGGFDEFQAINPVVKAPTLVGETGEVLMDSTLILQYLEALVPEPHRLTPSTPNERLRALRLTGLALAACEKTVQIVYERNLRPAEKQHQPWLDRVTGQLLAAYDQMESDLHKFPLEWKTQDQLPMDVGGVSVAVAWYFTQQALPGIVIPKAHPQVARWSALAEQQPAFLAAPYAD